MLDFLIHFYNKSGNTGSQAPIIPRGPVLYLTLYSSCHQTLLHLLVQ